MNLEIRLTSSHVERDEKWKETAKNYMSMKQMRMQFEEQEKKFFEDLKALSQGVASKAGGYVFTPSFRKGSVDYKAVPQLKGVDLDQYRTDSVEIWKLTYELIGE